MGLSFFHVPKMQSDCRTREYGCGAFWLNDTVMSAMRESSPVPGWQISIVFYTGRLFPPLSLARPLTLSLPLILALLLPRSQKKPSTESVHSVQKHWSSL